MLILGDEPGDGVWALVSPETYTYLIDGRGWSQTEAEDWFVDMTKAIIVREKS